MNAGKNDPSELLRKLKEKTAEAERSHKKYRQSQAKTEQKEVLLEQRKTAFHSNENDRISFGDFYKMTATVFSYPVYNILLAVFIGGMIYATPPAFEFTESVENYIPWGWQTLIVLVAIIHLIPVLLNALAALRLKFILRNLPFEIKGLGILVHRTQGRRFFRRCTIELIVDETTGVPRETMHEAVNMVLKLISHKAVQLSRNKTPGSWKIDQNSISGHASWRIAGRIITELNRHLKPVHKEARIVRSVIVSTPKGVPQSSEYFEWIPEGD